MMDDSLLTLHWVGGGQYTVNGITSERYITHLERGTLACSRDYRKMYELCFVRHDEYALSATK
jgi:hypothetical protein